MKKQLKSKLNEMTIGKKKKKKSKTKIKKSITYNTKKKSIK